LNLSAKRLAGLRKFASRKPGESCNLYQIGADRKEFFISADNQRARILFEIANGRCQGKNNVQGKTVRAIFRLQFQNANVIFEFEMETEACQVSEAVKAKLATPLRVGISRSNG